MTTKQYRTAMGKTVDMGALMLQNESTRAVGNMSVNARGDRLDSTNRVIDRKTKQAQRQYQKQSNVSGDKLSASVPTPVSKQVIAVDPADTFEDIPDDNDIIRDDVVEETAPPQGGLAAAIAKAKTVQQTKLTPPKQAAKNAGVRKI